MERTIVVLGRGISLKRLSEMNNDNIDTVILTNCFWDSKQVNTAYYKDPLIHNFIKNKKIYMVLTKYQDISKINIFIEKYNVIKVYKTNFSRYARIDKSDNLLDIMPESVLLKYIELDKLKITKKYLPCSLAWAILLATEELNATNIHIFGQDFYEKDYYLKNNHDYSNESSLKKIILFKKDITNFLSYLSNINFYVYTFADYEPCKKNIYIM